MAEPTTFHHFLRALDTRGVLLRVYTQNIDGLELKAGLHTSSEIHPEDGPARCIPLHGSLAELRCPGCASIFILEPYYSSLKEGHLPECAQCQAKMNERVQQGKRKTTVPRLRSNIILYGEVHPQGEEIAKVQQDDLGIIATQDGHPDVLLVAGTSLRVKGVIDFIKQYSQILKGMDFPGTSSQDSPQLIYLNDTFTNTAAWNGVFDAWIEADCEEFARLGLERMQEMSDKAGKGNQVGVCYRDRRLDYRPSWRWWSS
jgi:NAD-dependent SIR2 family protein deacetylase